MLCHQCTCTKNFWRQGHFIRNDPGRTQGSKQKCMSTRNTEDPTRSGEFRQGSDFQIVQLLCIQGSLFSQFSRLPNDLRTTSERHRDFSQNDHLSTKTHRPQSIHPMCAAFQVIDLIAICSTHGLIFPVTLSNFSPMFQNGPTMGLEMDRNGYDVADSSSDVDATSSIVQTVQNQAPRQKYEDRRLKIFTWFACGITICKPFFFSAHLGLW